MASRRMDGPRPVVIGTVAFDPTKATDPETFLSETVALVDGMARQAEERGGKLDLAVLPEASFQFASGGVADVAEALDGPAVHAFARKARQHGAYVTVPQQIVRDGRVYNSVVLLDRQGELVGVYDKVFPVMMQDASLEYGITPGREFPVFDLDFGRLGIQICWDIAFDEGWQALADQDAELVIFPTNPAVPTALKARSWQHGYYIVAATTHPPAVLVDPLGRVLGRTSSDREIMVSRVDLDFRVLHSNCLWDWPESRRKEYAGRINVDWDPEAHAYLVTSCDPGLPVSRFLEVEGLLTGRQRNRRNIARQLAERCGPLVMPEPLERE